MKAIQITTFGDPSVLQMTEVPTPTPKDHEVLIKISAFGLNHAEMHMRKGEWAEWMPISGIECVGTVEACPSGELQPGTPVASLMGGLGRTVNGSYAEFTVARVANVVPLGAGAEKLSWAQLAVIPESYATAWTCLFRNLEIKQGQKLLVRGGTSAFGRAAINLAVAGGVRVTATTRNEKRVDDLKALGVETVEIENPNLSESGSGRLIAKFDAVLDLIGNSTILDSLNLVRRGGRVCLAGFLGGLAPVPDFNPLLRMASGVHFSFFGSFVFGTPGFPLNDVPLQDIVQMVADGKFRAEPSRVFGFVEEDVQEAHRVMEGNEANGKMVVVVVGGGNGR
ncbi:chaperonin 10-like protein [Aspergillus venezuelensis]